jgi:hypothetical protein
MVRLSSQCRIHISGSGEISDHGTEAVSLLQYCPVKNGAVSQCCEKYSKTFTVGMCKHCPYDVFQFAKTNSLFENGDNCLPIFILLQGPELPLATVHVTPFDSVGLIIIARYFIPGLS